MGGEVGVWGESREVAVNDDDVILFRPANKRECPARPSFVRAVKFNKVVL